MGQQPWNRIARSGVLGSCTLLELSILSGGSSRKEAKVKKYEIELDYSAEVEAYQKSRQRVRATGGDIIKNYAHMWKGFALAGARFDYTTKRICNIHNEDLPEEHHVNEKNVRRAFHKIHSGWKSYCKSVRTSVSAIEPASSSVMESSARSLTDNRPVGGRIFGGAN